MTGERAFLHTLARREDGEISMSPSEMGSR